MALEGIQGIYPRCLSIPFFCVISFGIVSGFVRPDGTERATERGAEKVRV